MIGKKIRKILQKKINGNYFESMMERFSEFNSPEFKILFPAGKELMAEINEGFRFWFNMNDKDMGVLMALGLYEPESVELIKTLIKPGMKCLDIGGQSGYYTCLMASLAGDQGRVYAFEPMPSNYRLLVKNVKENRYEGRVQHYNLACSNIADTMDAYEVSNMYVVGKVDGAKKVTIETVRVDDVIKDTIDFIKIDIEGHEPSAIEGMSSLIKSGRPIILSEINEYWLRNCSNSDGNKYVSALMAHGYEIFNVNDLKKPIVANSLKLDILDKIDIIAYPKI